jgi:hypothetical protein
LKPKTGSNPIKLATAAEQGLPATGFAISAQSEIAARLETSRFP